MDFKEQFQQYENTLNQLKTKCTDAEKAVIVAETNIKNLKQQKEKLVKECEATAGVSIDDVAEVLAEKEAELNSIMTQLSAVNLDKDSVTQETLDSIKKITEQFNINPA